MDKDLLYFSHVQKTGGTFAVRVLEDALGERFVREGHAVPGRCMRPCLKRFGPALFTAVPRERCRVFSIVRNPFSLLVSMYRFGRGQQQHAGLCGRGDFVNSPIQVKSPPT